jgi:hypothetical protein
MSSVKRIVGQPGPQDDAFVRGIARRDAERLNGAGGGAKGEAAAGCGRRPGRQSQPGGPDAA